MPPTVSPLQGTGNQPYTPERVDYLASVLQSLLPGLTHDAATKWIEAERGVNGNVLGLTHNGQLYTYSSQEAGLAAAASWVKNGPGHESILTSLRTNDTQTQLVGIATSTWNPSYYQRLWNIKTASAIHDTPVTDTTSFWNGWVTYPTNTPLTQKMVDDIMATLRQHNAFGPESVASEAAALQTYNTLKSHIGEPWNPDLATKLSSELKLAADAAAGPFNTVNRVLGDVRDNFAFSLALIVGIPLALIGFYLLAGVQTGGQNA